MLTFLFILTLSSCKERSKDEPQEMDTAKKELLVSTKNTTLSWIAYKTSNKVPVKGQFTEFSTNHNPNASSALEAFDGLDFKIPISGLVTNDTIRDQKIKTFFFKTLKNTAEITGQIRMKTENSGIAKITLNGITKEIPISLTKINNAIHVEGVMDLNNWQAHEALKMLTAVCKDLHTGEDGIAKTWSEVKIEVVTELN